MEGAVPKVALAIETSQRGGGVALRAGSEVEVEMLRCGARHDDDLLPAIDRLLGRRGIVPRQLEVIGVSVGPGGFTGLRIAVSTAKMLGEVIGAPLVSIPTALVVAERFRRQRVMTGQIIVGLAAKAERFWATRLHLLGPEGELGWRTIGTPGLVGTGELDLDGVHAVIADQYLPEWAASLCAERGIEVAPPHFDPAAALAVTDELHAAGQITDPLRLSPLYPRPPTAVLLAKQAAAAK